MGRPFSLLAMITLHSLQYYCVIQPSNLILNIASEPIPVHVDKLYVFLRILPLPAVHMMEIVLV